MVCYVLAMGKQRLRPHVVVGYGIKIFWPGLFITSPDHLVYIEKFITQFKTTEKHDRSPYSFSRKWRFTSMARFSRKEKAAIF